MSPPRILQLTLLFFSALAQDQQTASLNEVISNLHISNLDTPLDPEELDMAKDMLVQDSQQKALREDMAWPLHTSSEDRKVGGVKHSMQLFEASTIAEHQKDGAEVDAAPLDLFVDDALPTNAAKSQKSSVSKHGKMDGVAASAASESNGGPNEDGAMDDIVQTRLASEEKFNLRLQKLLEQSSADSRAKQQKIVALEAQLVKLAKQQQQFQGDSLAKVTEEETEITRQTNRADTAEKQLRRANHELESDETTVAWLRDREKTLLTHLSSVTHIGKVLQRRLFDATSNAVSLSHKLEAVEHETESQRRVPLKMEAGLRKVQAAKASEDTRLQALEHQNELLRKRAESLEKRDNILQKENALLRGQLRGKTSQADTMIKELELTKASLSEAQKTNMQVQSKYADSLKALLTVQAGEARGGSALVGAVAGTVAPPPHAVVANDDIAGVAVNAATVDQAPSTLLELGRDSRRLSALVKDNVVTQSRPRIKRRLRRSVQRLTRHQTQLLQLRRDSQGLNSLLQGMPRGTN